MPTSKDLIDFLFVMFFFSLPATFVSIFGAISATRSSATFLRKFGAISIRLAVAIITGLVVTSVLISITVLCLGYVAFFLAVPILLLITVLSCWSAWKVATIASGRGPKQPELPEACSSEPIRRSGVRRDAQYILQLFGLLIAWFASGLVFPLALAANQGWSDELLFVPVFLVRAGILATGGWLFYTNFLSWKRAPTAHDSKSHYLSPIVGWSILGAAVLFAFFILAYAAFFTN